MQEQAGPELDQGGGVVAPVIEGDAHRHLPPEVVAQPLHGLLVRDALAVGEQEDLGQMAGRHRGPASALRVAGGKVAVVDDPVAVTGQEAVEGVLRHHVSAPGRVEEALLGPIGHREHPVTSEKALACRENPTNRAGRTRGLFQGSSRRTLLDG